MPSESVKQERTTFFTPSFGSSSPSRYETSSSSSQAAVDSHSFVDPLSSTVSPLASPRASAPTPPPPVSKPVVRVTASNESTTKPRPQRKVQVKPSNSSSSKDSGMDNVLSMFASTVGRRASTFFKASSTNNTRPQKKDSPEGGSYSMELGGGRLPNAF